jgi:DME family drug/metabolite transporter
MSANKVTLGQARRGIFLVMVSALCWGTIGVATEGVYRVAQTNALSIGFWRLAFAVPALWILLWRVVGPRALHIARKDLALMTVMGGMMALYQVSLFTAIPFLGVTVAVIITICSAPVLIAVLAAIFLGEKFTAHAGVALVLALAGTMLVANLTPEEFLVRGSQLEGVLWALGSGVGYAIITLVSRALAGRYHPLQPVSIGFTAGALLLLPLSIASSFVAAYPPTGWALLAYLGLVPTALAYWVFFTGMKATPATTASIVVLLEPLVAALLAAFLYQEQLPPTGWLGAGLLLADMGVLVFKK